MEQYINTLKSLRKNTFFKVGHPRENREVADRTYVTLMNSLQAVPGIKYHKYFDLLRGNDVKQILDNLRFEADYQPLAFATTQALKNTENYCCLTLAEKDGETLLCMIDACPMETGLFSETDFHQYIIIFTHGKKMNDPIGFSLNCKAGLTVILFPFRIEMYPSFALMSESMIGLTAMRYHSLWADHFYLFNFYSEDGTKKTPNLFQKFNNLDKFTAYGMPSIDEAIHEFYYGDISKMPYQGDIFKTSWEKYLMNN